jgi:hypothetical protein
VNFVIGEWTKEELKIINEKIPIVIEIIKSFGTAGLELTMTAFNKAGKLTEPDPGEKTENIKKSADNK